MAEKSSFFKKLIGGLSKTRRSIVNNLESLFMGVSSIDEDFYEELEEILISGDLGVSTTEKIMDSLREKVEDLHLLHPSDCKEQILKILTDEMEPPKDAYRFETGPAVVFVIGVNGVGKTTSIGKLAYRYRKAGKNVMMAACDTFRAAASDQLLVWSERAGVPCIAANEGSDPASVLYDALHAARKQHADLLFVDTAGRLHNKKNLMEELKKMNRIIDREFPEAMRENLIVLDATTGQNAIRQAKEFTETAELTGVVLTKMDGTAKGGVAIAVQNELSIPVKFIGVGEQIDDLEKFDAAEFVEALFETKEQ